MSAVTSVGFVRLLLDLPLFAFLPSREARGGGSCGKPKANQKKREKKPRKVGRDGGASRPRRPVDLARRGTLLFLLFFFSDPPTAAIRSCSLLLARLVALAGID